jgi:hypothetical protein
LDRPFLHLGCFGGFSRIIYKLADEKRAAEIKLRPLQRAFDIQRPGENHRDAGLGGVEYQRALIRAEQRQIMALKL